MRFISSIFSIYYFLQNSRADCSCCNNLLPNNINDNGLDNIKMPTYDLPINSDNTSNKKNMVINNLNLSIVTGTVTVADDLPVFTETPTINSYIKGIATSIPSSNCFGMERLLYLDFATQSSFVDTTIKAVKITINDKKNINNNYNGNINNPNSCSLDFNTISKLYSIFVKSKSNAALTADQFMLTYKTEGDAFYIILAPVETPTESLSSTVINDLIVVVSYNTYATTSNVSSVVTSGFNQVNISSPTINASAEVDTAISIPNEIVVATPAPSFYTYNNIPNECVLQLVKVKCASEIKHSEEFISEEQFKKMCCIVNINESEQNCNIHFNNLTISNTDEEECADTCLMKYFAYVSTSLTCFCYINIKDQFNYSFFEYANAFEKGVNWTFKVLFTCMINFCNIQTLSWKMENSLTLNMFNSYCKYNDYVFSNVNHMCDLNNINGDERYRIINACNISIDTQVKNLNLQSEQIVETEKSETEESETKESEKTTAKEPKKDGFFSSTLVKTSIIVTVAVVVVGVLGYSFM